jgi:ketosteroid isomerase-like protein
LAGDLSLDYGYLLAVWQLVECFAVIASYSFADGSAGFSDDLFRDAKVDADVSWMAISQIKIKPEQSESIQFTRPIRFTQFSKSRRREIMFSIQKNFTEDVNSLQKRIGEYCAAWTTQAGEPAWSTIEQLYADEDLMHYDAVTPHSFANVAGMKEAFAEMKKGLSLVSLELKARDGLNVFRRGDLVWTTVLQDIVAKTEDGNELRFVQRQTGIWEERNGCWVMLHEHLSAPSSLQD